MRHIITHGGQYDELLDAIWAYEGLGWEPGNANYGFYLCDDCNRWTCECSSTPDIDRTLTGDVWRGVFRDCCECWAKSSAFAFDEDIETPSPEALRARTERGIQAMFEREAAGHSPADLAREISRLRTHLDLARDTADILREMLAEARSELATLRAHGPSRSGTHSPACQCDGSYCKGPHHETGCVLCENTKEDRVSA